MFGVMAMVLVGMSWTIYGFIMGKAPKQKIDISCLMFAASVVAVLFSAGNGLIEGFSSFSGKGFLIAFIALFCCGTFNYYQLDIMSKAMQNGPNGIIWSVCQSGFIFPFFVGVLFFSEPLHPVQGCGFFIMILSLIFFGMCKDNNRNSGKWKLLTLLAFLMTGFSQTLQNIPSYFPAAQEISAVWRTCFYSLGIAVGAMLSNLKTLKSTLPLLKEQSKSKMFWLYIILLEGMEILVSFFLLFPGLDCLADLKLGAIAFPIMVCSCLIFFDLFSLLILREKHRLLQWIALALCITGVICLSVH